MELIELAPVVKVAFREYFEALLFIKKFVI